MNKQFYSHPILYSLFVLALIGATLIDGCDCPKSGTSTTTPTTGTTALAGCGPLTATIRGKVGTYEFSGTSSAAVTDNGTTIDWTFAEGKTETVVDGASGTGTIAAPTTPPTARAFRDTLKGKGGAIIIVTGTLNGPPPPCSGNGYWQVQNPPGKIIGQGSWTIK
jgi:hypothetical protein